ncbi:dephospho-CoA kinase [Candidatus Margulisiibacteriota bacterium]
MRVIGITGIIGTGKSTVCAILKDLGFAVIDADKVGHKLLRSSKTVKQNVLKAFGTVQRAKLADIVFSDPLKLLELNNILHPPMKKEIAVQIKKLKKQKYKGIALEAAVFVEMQLAGMVDEIWMITASQSNIIKRLKVKNLELKQIVKRLKEASSSKEMKLMANVTINNNSTITALRKKLKTLISSK